MVVDEEISIPANGSNQLMGLGNVSQMSLAKSIEEFYSAESQTLSTVLLRDSPSDDPVMTLIEDQSLSKESIFEGSMLEGSKASVCKESIARESVTDESPLDFQQERRRSITDENSMQDIDPLGLIAFDSPSRFSGRPAPSHALTGHLLDVDIMASPQSMAKYTQRDFDRLKGEFEKRAEKQAEFMQFEIQAVQEKYDASLQTNNELRILMAEYENTMSQILGTPVVMGGGLTGPVARCAQGQQRPAGDDRAAPAGQAAAADRPADRPDHLPEPACPV